MRKFRATTQPEAAKERVFYGRANDPDVASRIVHGVNTKSSLVVRILFASCIMYHVKNVLFFLSSINHFVKSLLESNCFGFCYPTTMFPAECFIVKAYVRMQIFNSCFPVLSFVFLEIIVNRGDYVELC